MADPIAPIKEPSKLSPRARWQAEIKYAEKELNTFYTRAEAANKRYLDERDAIDIKAKKFNIFYANTNILESALYSQVPKPCVSRKYADYRDDVARVAALILERSLGQDLNDPADLFDATMRQAVQDRLVPGMGTAWLRLETDTEDIPESEGGSLTNDTQSLAPEAEPGDDGFLTPPQEAAPSTNDPAPVGQGIALKKIKDQRVAVDYVYWRDFIFSPCRTWSERRWVGRKVDMDFDQLKARFGEAKAKLVSFSGSRTGTQLNRSPEGTTPRNNAVEKATVYEIWDRMDRKVIWFCEGYADGLLDTKDDFLGLQSFEPCPEPMFANTTTSNCAPRPDYYMIQDQYIELDTVNARISLLVSACKVVGVYNKNATGIIDLFSGNENQMVPVDNWAMFAEKGGTKGNMDWLPLEMIVAALQKLYEAREAIKGQIYELTGIADIVRGASKASETLGAQQIKAQFASVRIKKLQDEVARFASNILRIKAEIMVKHFDPEILIRKSGITRTDNDEFIASAIVLLQSEEGFNWRVTVQADSMAQADYTSEKADRIEMMSAVSGYLGNALPMTMQIPESKPIILGMLKWAIAGFKQAQDIEGMLDRQLAALEGKPPAPPPPDPKMAAVQAKIEGDKQKAQIDQAKAAQDAQIKQEEFQQETEFKKFELMFQERMNQMEMVMKQFELQMKREEMGMKREEHQQDLQFKQVEGAQNIELQRAQGEQQLVHGEQQHELAMEQTKATGELQLKQGEQQGEQKLKLAAKAAAQKPVNGSPK